MTEKGNKEKAIKINICYRFNVVHMQSVHCTGKGKPYCMKRKENIKDFQTRELQYFWLMLMLYLLFNAYNIENDNVSDVVYLKTCN